MLNYTCRYCGNALRIREGRMGAQCCGCGRYYSSDALYAIAQRSGPAVRVNEQAEPQKIAALVTAVIVLLFMLAFSPLPMVVLCPALIIFACRKLLLEAEAEDADSKPRGAGEQLRTADDFLRAFQMMALESMPLREEARCAIMQLDSLKRKQLALAAMLPADHPFLRSGNDASEYILRNTKQIYYRLRFCDQSDLGLRQMHAAFLRERLDENSRILRDFENLIIEVTQMNDTDVTPVPALDVLAETLYTMRTGKAVQAQIADMDDQFMRGDY